MTIARETIPVDGKNAKVITINGSYPGPLVRLTEGNEAVLRVHNTLDEPTSIHWHGLLVPEEMDGVPGVSFA
ncbi:MAG: multicopper oxidase domain-containing protein, partial [Myxococcota bacterium]